MGLSLPNNERHGSPVSDKLQFVEGSRKRPLAEPCDKLKFVGHFPSIFTLTFQVVKNRALIHVATTPSDQPSSRAAQAGSRPARRQTSGATRSRRTSAGRSRS